MTDTVRDYVEAVFARVHTPLEPPGFTPDWDDQPSRFKTYRDVVRVPLPASVPDRLAPLGQWRPDPTTGSGGLDLSRLATLQLLSYGVLDRRLRVNWNDHHPTIVSLASAVFSRGSPSGGGLYPLELYWAAGPSGPLLPGIYHYSPAHHALDRLMTGDVTTRVRAALLGHPAGGTDQFLFVTARFWKNAFKYNNFSYHVITQDVGALLGSLELVGRGLGVSFEYLTWFSDEDLNRLLGLTTHEESVLAVVPLPWDRTASVPEPRADPPEPIESDAEPGPQKRHFERSRQVVRFPRPERVHQATLISSGPRPDRSAGLAAAVSEPAGPNPIALPTPAPLARDVVTTVLSRRSSFGRFEASRLTSQAELGAVLAFTAAARDYRTDVSMPAGPRHLTRLAVFVSHVEGLTPGTYGYAAAVHQLHPLREWDVAPFLQRQYLLHNYNLEQVGAVVAIIGRPDPMLAAFGPRGYRLLNAEAGLLAQAWYLSATAVGLGCGAVLGLDNVAMNEALGLAEGDERTLLFLLLGHERGEVADIASPLVRQRQQHVDPATLAGTVVAPHLAWS